MSRRPLRILDLRDSPWVDGPGRTILQSASMVDAERCEIIVGAFYGDVHGEHSYLQEAKARKLSVLPIKELRAFDFQVVGQILDAVENLSIDIIHTHDFRSDLYGLLCARKTGKPVVSTCHGWIANNLKGKIYTSLDRFMLRFFDRVITVSDTMRGQLEVHGINKERINVILNALIIDQYNPDHGDQAFRHELGIDPSTLLIANIGRLSPEKGQDIFLRAAAELLKVEQGLCFVLIGVGPQKEYLQQLSRDLNIDEHVVFAGYRSDMTSIYNSLDLVVQSSYTEGMPNVILESMLMEVPVVATTVGGTAEIVQHLKTGFLISPREQNQLVDGIMDYIHNRSQHKEYARNGREYVSQHFDHNQRVEKLMSVYEDVFRRKGKVK